MTAAHTQLAGAGFERMWARLSGMGAHPAGGFTRLAWSTADAELRRWFRAEAAQRDMPVEQDRNGNLWAWWGSPGQGAVASGSHLDSVPNGGAFDGPLGVVCSFLAVDLMRERGARPLRPLAVACFSDEEGARFGVACVGSRLMCGALDPEAARGLTDGEGTTLAEAMEQAGADPSQLGPDPERAAALAAFVELHVEQGRALADLGEPLGIGSEIWPHGRWRLSFQGEANHAGTTLMADRHDPMLPFAEAVLEARRSAERHGGRATMAKVLARPNATNAISARVEAWLDARGPDDEVVGGIVAAVEKAAAEACAGHGVGFALARESYTPRVDFDAGLRGVISGALGRGRQLPVPQIPTAAGHDAAILASRLPTAMLFVRNPTGASHTPLEAATTQDCLAGVEALARVLEELTCR